LSLPLREVLMLCDLGGQSHAQAAAALGSAKGTVTKRLAKAREELASRLTRRGITLGVGALSTMIATQARASVPASLLLETAKQAVAFSLGQASGSATAKNLAEGVMRSLKFGALKAWLVVGVLGLALTGGGLMLAGGLDDSPKNKAEQVPGSANAKPVAAKVGTMWKETYAAGEEGKYPVSVAFSGDGKWLLTGDTNGEVTALILSDEYPTARWKSKADGSHAALAYSADQKHVYVTTAHGLRILDAATGNEKGKFEWKDSNPIAIGVFPNRTSAKDITQSQIVFGGARGYFIASVIEDKIHDVGGGEVSNVTQDAEKDAK